MAWIKAPNGNVFEVDDVEHVKKILRETDGAKAYESDPREKAAKAWKAPADAEADDADEA